MTTSIFTKDYASYKVGISCSFKAPLNVIWDAFSNPATLEKWFAPKPYKAQTKKADFREGGYWHYYMLSPKDEKTWGMTKYLKIRPMEMFEASDAFCDEQGNINPKLPQLHWVYNFSEINGITTVLVTISLPDEIQLRQLLDMGFEEGYQIAITQLQEMLKQ